MEIGFAVKIIIFCQQYLRTHELNQASLKVGHSMNLWRPRLCTTSSLRTKTYPLSLTATKSKKSIITSTSVIAFPWIPPQRNKKSNIVSPSDDKLGILPTVTHTVELNLTNNKPWTQNYAESPRKNHALHQVESLLNSSIDPEICPGILDVSLEPRKKYEISWKR